MINKTFKEINERPELYDDYDEFIESEGYLYDDLDLNYSDNNEYNIEEGREEWD